MATEKSILDLSEKGKSKDGQPISLDRRLFMQFLAYGNCARTDPLIEALEATGIEGVLYADINDPQGAGLLTLAEAPDFCVTRLRSVLTQPPFAGLTLKPEYTMLGRTYALGYEDDLEETLISRPRRKVLDPAWCWAVWYPLQRVKDFERLPEKEQQIVLREHGGIGFTWESDCQLYYRRSKLLALTLGGVRDWKHRLIDQLEHRTTAPLTTAGAK